MFNCILNNVLLLASPCCIIHWVESPQPRTTYLAMFGFSNFGMLIPVLNFLKDPGHISIIIVGSRRMWYDILPSSSSLLYL